MRAADLVTAVVLMLFGGLVLWDTLRLGIGWGPDGPRSGFFPFWLAVLLLLASVGVFIQALRRSPMGSFVTREQLRPVLHVVVPMAAFVVLISPPGLPWGLGAIYLAFYMRWVGRHDWRAVIALAVLVPVVTFIVFERWFLVPMPKGPLEAWLGY